ncbi:MAG: SusC/RagA family TonB-linked outer membrane protein [Bacteroidales bacterium]|nr:SusC/RagA family TonB-linked outer membrane protein [Bacteroidales bacterium]
MKRILTAVAAILLLGGLFSTSASAQGGYQVKGVVIDALGPVYGATVMEKGTTNGVSTGMDGDFILKVSGENAVVEISCIGYSTQTFPANAVPATITLAEDNEFLDEVVVIGYGSQSKKEVTGSVASLKPDDFNQGSVANPMGLLQGKVSGLNVIKNGGDDPAQNSYNVQLRGVGSLNGSTEPLYVIDGVPGGNLSSVQPADIESIDILKDGSAAAIYGTRANAGVILITTRRGNKDGAFSAEYNGNASVGFITNVPRVLNSQEYRDLMVAKGLGTDFGADTDWIKAISRNPISHTHNVSITGGTEKFNYRASVGYRNLQGIALKSDFDEIQGRFAADQKALNDRLQISYDFSYTRGVKDWANYDNFNQAIRSNPTMPIYSDDEKFVKYGGYYESDNFYTRNPVSDIEQTTNQQKDQNIIGSVRATLDICRGLKFTTAYSLQETSTWNGKYQKSTLREVSGRDGVASQSYAAVTQQVVENTLNYMGSAGRHNYQFLLGQSYQTNLSQNFSANNSIFPLDKVLFNNLGLGEGKLSGKSDEANMSSYKYKDKLASFFVRGMYNFAGKYFLSASARLEGSSKFGAKANPVLGPWGLFPSVSASWIITEEDWMKNVTWLDELKLRAGYGVTGNMPGSSYLYMMLVGPGSDYIFSNGKFILPWGPQTNVNEYIRWEEKRETNVGLDFAMFDGRFWGTVDGYFRNTTNLLYEYDVPLTGGNVSAKKWDNYGQIHNYGVELSLNGIIMKTHDLNWTAGLNAAWNRNRVVRITGEQYGETDAQGNHIAAYQNVGYISSGDGETGNYVMRLVEGEAVGNYYGLKYATIKDDGTWMFFTPAGGYTSEPTDADKQVLGNAFPLVTLGFYTTLNYKNFDLGLNFRGQIGGLYFNETRYFYENTRGTENVLLSSFSGEAEKLTHWIDNPGSTKASLRRFSDFYLEDATYVKLNDVTFGWTPAIKGAFSDYVKSLRLYINAQNLFTITKYQGHDPSTVNLSGLAPGFDGRSYYPTQRTVSLGVNINF